MLPTVDVGLVLQGRGILCDAARGGCAMFRSRRAAMARRPRWLPSDGFGRRVAIRKDFGSFRRLHVAGVGVIRLGLIGRGSHAHVAAQLNQAQAKVRYPPLTICVCIHGLIEPHVPRLRCRNGSHAVVGTA
jgi:hypothetical protein